MLKVMKEKNLQPKLVYPARISFKYDGEFKIFIAFAVSLSAFA